MITWHGLQPGPVHAIGGDVAVVVHPDTPSDDLSLSEVRNLLLLGERQSWNGKLRVTLLVRAPAARERDVVLKIIYRKQFSVLAEVVIEADETREGRAGCGFS